MSAALLELRNVTRAFGALKAIDGVSLEVRAGETLGLLGDNGAGKSTLIKLMAGFYEPSSGEMVWEGKAVQLGSPKQARELGIETVYQDLGLIEELSIARNFFLGKEPTRGPFLDLAQMNRVAGEALAETGVRVRDPRVAVRNLSGGERQAIAIGRAWHFGSRVLILDEPTSALSIQETRKVFSYVDQAKKRGMGVVLITHNLIHAQAACDRFVVIHHGRKVGEFGREASRDELEKAITEGVMPNGSSA